jgi:hypothetical protein
MRIISGIAVFAAIIVDTVLVFSELQNADTGAFDLSGLTNVDWISFAVVTVVCLGAAIVLQIVEKTKTPDNQ